MADPATQAFASTEIVHPPRKPFYKDPLSIIGWGIALASIVAYWYYFVRKPVPKPGQEIARITAVEGKVKVKPNETEAWNPAKLTDRLHVGDTVQTEPRSGAEVSFHAGSVVRVRPDSIVYIGGSAESSTAAWRVQSGRVNFAIGDQQTEIVTPTLKTTAETMLVACEADLDYWHRPGSDVSAGLAEWRLSPPRKFSWWFGTTADMPWLLGAL